MSEVVQIGLPVRPPWARNWWEKLQLRFHVTPKHMKEVLAQEELLLSRIRSALELVKVASPDCGATVYWPEKRIMFRCDNESIGSISFDAILATEVRIGDITDLVLSLIKH